MKLLRRLTCLSALFVGLGAPTLDAQCQSDETQVRIVGRQTADFRSGWLVRVFDFGTLPTPAYKLRIRAGDQVFFVKIVVNH